MAASPTIPTTTRRHVLPALAVWMGAWVAMGWLDGRLDLTNLAMVLVLASALATLWLPIAASMTITALSVLAFNWLFVPPRHTFAVDVRQDALLLAIMLAVSWIVAGLVVRLRVLADTARLHAQRAVQLRSFGEALRDTDDPLQSAGSLRAALGGLLGSQPHLMLLKDSLPAQYDPDAVVVLGDPTADELSGLWQCMRQSQPFGPGTGRHADLRQWYLPLRGGHTAFGAAVVTLDDVEAADDGQRLQAQALCDQMGMALQRAQARRAEQAARGQAQAQGVRNALLAAISHDHRTPLATIIGAASSLLDQGERLSAEQRQRLARTVLDEATQLSRLTDNTLQLARLDAPGVPLQLDWESAEEIVGVVLRRLRTRDAERRVHARLEPGLPLLRCDAFLLAQMLENLLDNALKYSPPPQAIEVLVRRRPGHVVLAVRDRGPGVPPAWRERIFEVFQRGEPAPHGDDAGSRRGAGVGLAVSRAIARAHGGELKIRPRAHGGSSFECWLPEAVPPPLVDAAEPVNGRAP